MALPRIGVGLGHISELQPKEWGGHTAAQTISAIVMASAAVFAVVFQSKGDPKFAWSLLHSSHSSFSLRL